MDVALSGVCTDCGYALVQIALDGGTVRTYHPHFAIPQGETCPALLPIGDTEYLSSDVPTSKFKFGE